jgi:arylformamidase
MTASVSTPCQSSCSSAVTGRKGIGPDDLSSLDLSEDIRVLFKTQNSRLWGSSEFRTDYIGMTEAGAKHLVERGVKVVGVDYLSVEEFRKPGAPAHRVLLGNGTIVIEGLNLRDVEPGSYEMFCLPLRIVGADGAPARVILRRN